MSSPISSRHLEPPAAPPEPPPPRAPAAVTAVALPARRPSPAVRRQRRAAWLFLAPACAMVAVYVIWPILSTLWLSLFNWDGM
ncbi:sugar ABC transporter permease, partial [Burkholderia pseudomallei]|nr:sugar ABC transporter permease [Burkholderia pseudomallei]